MPRPVRRLRSLLFVPGDSERKLARIGDSGADAVILDLEDAVAPPNKALARELVTAYLAAHPVPDRRAQLWVRINPLATPLAEADLRAVVAACPDGIMQPKIEGPADVAALSARLDTLETEEGLEPGSIRVLPVVTETPLAPFRLGDFAGIPLPRLAGLTWGAEDLAAALGASTNLGSDGDWAFTYRLVRSLTLLAASAAGVPAYETLYVDIRDTDGLRRTSEAARAEGWSGRIAIHPGQVEVINTCFTPSPAELEQARRIVEAFATTGAGVIELDGKMLDLPHLKLAQRLLGE